MFERPPDYANMRRMMTTTRRSFLKKSGTGLFLFSLGGVPTLMTPAEARAKDLAFTTLSPDEAKLLEAFGEVLVPGAAQAGVAHFIDQQLGAEPNECLLLCRMFNLTPPYVNFYRAGLTALAAVSQGLHGKPFPELDGNDAHALVETMSEGFPDGWQGPPAPLFYVLVRSDAVDVVYGTPQGFDDLGIPYMPHIMPPEPW